MLRVLLSVLACRADLVRGIGTNHRRHGSGVKNVTTASVAPSSSGPRVLVIGFGPSGMFFCHHVERRRRELERRGDLEGLRALPVVEVHERAATHGGVWRRWSNYTTAGGVDVDVDVDGANNDDENESESESESDKNGMPMYEAMWVNGAKELAEFFDHTYDEHFGCALPPYVQRGAMLEYMEARVTKDCPDFFHKYATYNSEVTSVVYDDASETFTVTTRNTLTQQERTSIHDKVIWAAGVNTVPYVPQQTWDTLRQNFTGTMIHSSEVNNLQEDIKGKRVLLVGGASSAEDLALTALKLGADNIFISYRNRENSVSGHPQWPYLDRVRTIPGMVPVTVTHGEGQYANFRNCVDFEYVEPVDFQVINDENWDDFDDEYPDFNAVEICNIDTIIFCTGYRADFSMLHPSVTGTPHVKEVDIYKGPKLKMPDDWTMPDNVLSDLLRRTHRTILEEDGVVDPNDPSIDNEDFRHIPPADEIRYFHKHPYLHLHSVTMDNPHMMYLVPNAVSLDQLLWADVLAHYLLATITGDAPLPDRRGMHANLFGRLHHEMSIPTRRYSMDRNYRRVMMEYVHHHYDPFHDSNDGDGSKNVDDGSNEDARSYRVAETEESRFHFRSLAEVARASGYPLDVGTFRELNEVGETLVGFDMHDRNSRRNEHQPLRTFRDLEVSDLRHIYSVHTGTRAIGFRRPWMEIDDFADARRMCGPIVHVDATTTTTTEEKIDDDNDRSPWRSREITMEGIPKSIPPGTEFGSMTTT